MAMDLKSINLKRQANTLIKVMMDIKVLSMLVLLVFTFYAIGYDTVFKPSMEQLKARDEAIQQQREILEQKRGLQSQYKVWEQELKGMDAQMIPIPPGESAKVISVTETAKLVSLAKGQERDEKLIPPLLPPHNVRNDVVLTPGETTEVDLLKPEDPNAANGQQTPAPQVGTSGQGMGGMTSAPTSVPVQRFDFQMKMSGTYPALVDFVNQLIMHANIIKINSISINKVASTDEPDARDFPDYAVPVEMTLLLSMYLYDAPPQQ